MTAEELEELKAIQEMENAKAPSRAPGQIPYDTTGMSQDEAEELRAILEAERSLGEGATPAQAPAQEISEQVNPWAAGMKPGERSARLATSGEARAYAEGAGNEVSMGYLPQLQAKFEQYFMPDATAEVDAKLRAEGFDIPERGYVQMRDENIKSREALESMYPEQSMAGKVSGIATTMTPISRGLKAMKLAGQGSGALARLASAGAGGAAISGAYNPGDKEGVIDPIQGWERTKSAMLGLGTGMLGQGVAELAGGANQAIRKAPEKMQKAAEEFTFRSLGPTMKDIKKLAPQIAQDISKKSGGNSSNQIAKTLLDNKIVEAGDTVEDILRKSNEALNQTANQLDDVYTRAEQAIKGAKNLNPLQREYLRKGMPDGRRIARAARERIKGMMANDPGAKLHPDVKTYLDAFEDAGANMDVKKMRTWRGAIDDNIKWGAQDQQAANKNKQLKAVRSLINKEIENYNRAADKVLGEGSDLVKELKDANRKYSHIKSAKDVAEDHVLRNQKNQFFTLTDKIAGAAGMAGQLATAGDPAGIVKAGLFGLVTSAASKYGRKYGAPMAAKLAQRLGDNLKKPAAFAKFGKPIIEAARKSPEELQAVLQQFRNDPEFEKLMSTGGR